MYPITIDIVSKSKYIPTIVLAELLSKTLNSGLVRDAASTLAFFKIFCSSFVGKDLLNLDFLFTTGMVCVKML